MADRQGVWLLGDAHERAAKSSSVLEAAHVQGFSCVLHHEERLNYLRVCTKFRKIPIKIVKFKQQEGSCSRFQKFHLHGTVHKADLGGNKEKGA